MSIERPNPRDFGVTQEQYDLYARGKLDKRSSGLIVVCSRVVAFLAIVALFRESWVLSLEMLVPLFLAATVALVLGSLLAMPTEAVVGQLRRYSLRETPVASEIKLYEEAEKKYYVALREARTAQREAEWAWWEAEQARRDAERARLEAERIQRMKAREHWMSLGGVEFERELGTLFRHLGYRVEWTPGSGDQGVDLVLRRDGKTIVVQCKSHQSPVGPAIVRELYGSMVAFPADSAVLACTGGFTRGVKEFTQGKPISLISAQNIISLVNSVPLCPNA